MAVIPEGFDYHKPHEKDMAMYLRKFFNSVPDGTVIGDRSSITVWRVFPSKRELWLVGDTWSPTLEYLYRNMRFWGWKIIEKG